jgi:hypothetical protein
VFRVVQWITEATQQAMHGPAHLSLISMETKSTVQSLCFPVPPNLAFCLSVQPAARFKVCPHSELHRRWSTV